MAINIGVDVGGTFTDFAVSGPQQEHFIINSRRRQKSQTKQ